MNRNTDRRFVVADDQFVDIEGVDGVGDTVSAISRSGPASAFHRFSSRAEHDRVMLERLTEVLRLIGTERGEVGILTATNRRAADVESVLRGAGVPVVMLDEYSGRTIDAVRVGTVKRAKGLEFKQVLLAQVDRGLVDAAPAESPESDRERRERGPRELYVGMTRARDGLWVGVRNGVTRSH